MNLVDADLFSEIVDTTRLWMRKEVQRVAGKDLLQRVEVDDLLQEVLLHVWFSD